ncbi:hypothetical protein BJ741DRAFT_580685 [Chytriomyces cf. hyalinus JEL632]|nr:hypothetical protein BJ741DRAFT_580685 [Chytriomyces cf. hyalinus JEL632]
MAQVAQSPAPRKLYRNAVSTVGSDSVVFIKCFAQNNATALFIQEKLNLKEKYVTAAALRVMGRNHSRSIQTHSLQLSQRSFNSTMIKYLKAAQKPMFISPFLMLSNEYETVEDFLEDLTQVAGSVYIVLDGIESAFVGNDLKVRHQFLLFCKKILSHWFALPNVFFVVLGRTSVINNVGRQPADIPMRGIRFHFERLNPGQDQDQLQW